MRGKRGKGGWIAGRKKSYYVASTAQLFSKIWGRIGGEGGHSQGKKCCRFFGSLLSPPTEGSLKKPVDPEFQKKTIKLKKKT